MTRISLVNLEPIRLTQLQTPTAGRSSISELTPGDILTAQVVRSLGSGRFLLNLQGNQLVAASNSPLTSGQQISLQVSSNHDGQASVHLLTLAEGTVAEVGGKPSGHAVDLGAGQIGARQSSLISQLPREAFSEPDADAVREVSARLQQVLRSDGPLQRLLERKPELAPRIEALVTQILNRPRGLGPNITQLQAELRSVLNSLPAARQPALASTQNRLAAQLFPAELMDHPEELAQNLVTRFESIAKGLEASLAKVLPEAEAAQTHSGPTSAANSKQIDEAATATAKETAAKSSEAASTSKSNALIQRTFEGDLKGQLLELRSQLHQLSEQNLGNNSLQQAISRTDTLLEQVTAQQVRNLDGLNQFVYADIPVDPKTGIQEARLQVFYRNRHRGNGGSGSEVDRFTIAMFLNMTRLGDVMTVVSSIEGSLSVGFTVGDEAAEQLLAEHSQGLREALSAAGHPAATVTVRRTTNEAASAGVDENWDEFLSLPLPPSSSGQRLNSEA